MAIKTGRKPIQINWEVFDKLVARQCTQIEVASFFDVSVDTLEDACLRDRGERLADVWQKRRMLGRIRLRSAQFDILERGGSGAAVLAIYLDKKMFPDEQPPPQPTYRDLNPIEPQPVIDINSQLGTGPKLTFKEFCLKAGYPEPYEQQELMRKFIFDREYNLPRILLGSRGYGKTDYGTALGTAYELYLDPNYRVLIMTKSMSRNKAILVEIAHALKKVGIVFETENSKELKIAGLIGKELSVEAITIKSGLRGRHPNLIIMDDPVTEDDVSEATRKLAKKKYDEAYKLTSNICLIGQPAHPFDLYANLRDTIRVLEMPWGTIPELDTDLEAAKLAGLDERSIEMSYHLRIPKDGSSLFANIQHIDELPFGQTVAFIDPSDGGDYTAVSVFKGHMGGVAVEGYAWKKAWFHCLDEFQDIFKRLSVVKVAFETNATGSQPIDQLRLVFHPLGIGVAQVHSTTNKHSTIVSAGSLAHNIRLSKKSSKVYTDMVVQYEYGSKHDDAPDSLARGLEWLGLLRGNKK